MNKEFFKKVFKESLKLLDIKISRYSRYLEHLRNLEGEKEKEKLDHLKTLEEEKEKLDHLKTLEEEKEKLEIKIKSLEDQIFIKENSIIKTKIKNNFVLLKQTNENEEINEKLKVSQIYISQNNNPPGELTQEFMNSVKKGFPDADYKLFNNKSIKNFLSRNFSEKIINTYNQLNPYAAKADLARLCILYKLGGWYFDVGIEWIGGKEIVDNKTTLIAFRDIQKNSFSSWACINAVIYSKPSNPILAYAIKRIVDNCERKFYGLNPLWPTSVVVFGEAIANSIIDDNIILGDFVETTPQYKFKNFSFLMPNGKIICRWKPNTNHGRLSEIDKNLGTNDYSKIWEERNWYGEKN